MEGRERLRRAKWIEEERKRKRKRMRRWRLIEEAREVVERSGRD
jgi:hypothetical protein